MVRRSIFIGLSILLTATGVMLMLSSYSGQKLFWEDYVCIGIFPLLFSQIAVGFVLALFGLFDQLRGGDPHHLMRGPWREKEETIPLAATAIVVPVYNEDVDRVSKGVANMWRSLEATGQLEHFDFYICSDSNDADHWVEEECAWMAPLPEAERLRENLSTASAGIASTARAATWPISAAAGASATGT